MIFEGWCPDCDLQSVLVDTGDGPDHGAHAWATCTECGIGWTWQGDLPERDAEPLVRAASPRRLADRAA